MTQEDKNLLLKDLCARLPYGVRGVHRDRVHYLMNVDWGFGIPSIQVDGYDARFSIDTFKPYLRSFDSMTEEERKESGYHWGNHKFDYDYEFYDWLNAHHFDYRGLIEKGLAIEVTEENNPYKE